VAATAFPGQYRPLTNTESSGHSNWCTQGSGQLMQAEKRPTPEKRSTGAHTGMPKQHQTSPRSMYPPVGPFLDRKNGNNLLQLQKTSN